MTPALQAELAKAERMSALWDEAADNIRTDRFPAIMAEFRRVAEQPAFSQPLGDR